MIAHDFRLHHSDLVGQILPFLNNDSCKAPNSNISWEPTRTTRVERGWILASVPGSTAQLFLHRVKKLGCRGEVDTGVQSVLGLDTRKFHLPKQEPPITFISGATDIHMYTHIIITVIWGLVHFVTVPKLQDTILDWDRNP